MKKISHFIDGKVYTDSKSRKGPIFNPAIGEQIAEVELASKATVEKAIQSSAKAFVTWSKTTPINRSRILAKYKDLLIKNMEELAVMVDTFAPLKLTKAAIELSDGKYHKSWI